VLNEPWLEAGGEARLIIHRITHAVLALGGGVLPPGVSVDDFSGRWIRANPGQVSIIDEDDSYEVTQGTLDNLRRAEVQPGVLNRLEEIKDQVFVGGANFLEALRATLGQEQAAEHQDRILSNAKRRVVLFPLILNYRDAAKSKQIWVKAGLYRAKGRLFEEQTGSELIETLLRDALSEVQSGQIGHQVTDKTGKTGHQVEDEKGRLQVTLDVKAIISETQEGARKTALDAK
jgi:hypothetical protein